MRRSPTKKIEQYRITEGPLASDKSYGANGAFRLPINGVGVSVIVSDGSHWRQEGLTGEPWEHVSVSIGVRCPTWEEMDYIKRLFWRDDETVMQLHVPRGEHISFHDTCLHLWKPKNSEIPRPPSVTVQFGACRVRFEAKSVKDVFRAHTAYEQEQSPF